MTSLVVGCHACALWPNGAYSYYGTLMGNSYYGTLIGNPTPGIQWYNFRPPGVTPNRGMAPPREALFVKLLWPLVFGYCTVYILYVTWGWTEPGGISRWPGWLTIVLQCYGTVGIGWVMWLVRSSLKWPTVCWVGRYMKIAVINSSLISNIYKFLRTNSATSMSASSAVKRLICYESAVVIIYM